MTRAQLEHLLRAAAVIADDDEIVVIGSQAILGQFPDAPASMRVSNEADLFPHNHPAWPIAKRFWSDWKRWMSIHGSGQAPAPPSRGRIQMLSG